MESSRHSYVQAPCCECIHTVKVELCGFPTFALHTVAINHIFAVMSLSLEK